MLLVRATIVLLAVSLLNCSLVASRAEGVGFAEPSEEFGVDVGGSRHFDVDVPATLRDLFGLGDAGAGDGLGGLDGEEEKRFARMDSGKRGSTNQGIDVFLISARKGPRDLSAERRSL